MLFTLLSKDVRRARRNPWPYLINLALPLCITGLIGLAFGPSSKGGGLGRVKLAVVDEDDSVLTGLLRGAVNQGEFKEHIEARFLPRGEALLEINRDKLSAVVIIPKGFTRTYLSGGGPVSLELVKNPAQSIYPAIVEELLGVAAAGLNALARNLPSDLPEWSALLEKEGRPDMKRLGGTLGRVGRRFEKAEGYLFPPLVTYGRETRHKAAGERPAGNIFAFLLPGLAAMFLLFLADNAIRDVYREVSAGTLDRFRTLHGGLGRFVASKVVLAMVIVTAGSVVMFGGGAWIFGIRWAQPLWMGAVIGAFGLFASGFMAFIAAVGRSARRAEAIHSAIILRLAFIGGSFFPAKDLPPAFRDHLSPLMPNYWFIEALRGLQSGVADAGASAGWAAIRLLVLGTVLVLAASWVFRRALEKGNRA